MDSHAGQDRGRDAWDDEMDAAHTAYLDTLGQCDALTPDDVIRHDSQWLMVDHAAPGGVRELTDSEQRHLTEMLLAYQVEHQCEPDQLELAPGDDEFG